MNNAVAIKRVSSARPPRWIWMLVVVAILAQTAVNLLRPATSYKLLSLGLGETEIGLATSAFALLPLVFAMTLGRISSRTSKLLGMIIWGATMMGIGGLLLAFTDQVWALFSASALLGMGLLLLVIGSQSAIGRGVSGRHLDAAFGWFTAGAAVGQMLGPLLLGVILGDTPLGDVDNASAGLLWNINSSLGLGATLVLIAIPLIFVSRNSRMQWKQILSSPKQPNYPRAPRVCSRGAVADWHTGTGRPKMLGLLKVPGLPSHILSSMVLLVTVDILVAFMPLVGEAYGTSPMAVGVLLAVRGGASVASRIFLPLLVRRFTRNNLVLASLLGSTISVALAPVLLVNEQFFWLVCLVMGLAGLFLGLGQPITLTQISQEVATSWRGSALALRLVGNRLGQVVLPVAAGIVAIPLGPAGGLWLACAAMGGSALERILSGRFDSTRRAVAGLRNSKAKEP